MSEAQAGKRRRRPPANTTPAPNCAPSNGGAVEAMVLAIATSAAEMVATRLLAGIDQRIEAAISRALDDALERREGVLLPFEQIVPSKARKDGKRDKAAAARAWLRRHPEIRKLGIRVGQRLLFRRDEVLAVLHAAGTDFVVGRRSDIASSLEKLANPPETCEPPCLSEVDE